MIPWDVDIRPPRPRGPEFKFLAWGKDSIFWPTTVGVAGPPGARPEGPIVGRSLFVPSLHRLNAGDRPVVVNDELEGWVASGTPAGPQTRAALGRILDRLLLFAWTRQRTASDADVLADVQRVNWLLSEIRFLDTLRPVWSPFHCRVAGDFVMRILSPTYRFTPPGLP